MIYEPGIYKNVSFDDILSMPDPFPIMGRENKREAAIQAHLRAIDWAIGKIEGEK